MRNTAFCKQLIMKELCIFKPEAAPSHLSSQSSVLNDAAGRPA